MRPKTQKIVSRGPRPTVRLRTLLAAFAACGVFVYPLAARIAENRRADAAIARLGSAASRRQTPPTPRWAALFPIALRGEIWPRRRDCTFDVIRRGAPLTDGILSELRWLPRVRVLIGGNSPIGDAGAAEIGQLSELEVLDLRGAHVTDAGAQQFSTLPRLERLSLERTEITDDGLAHIAATKSLRCLDVSNTSITDTGVRHLVSMPRLQVLTLTGTDITDGAAAALASMPTLRILDVRNTRFTAAGGAVVGAAISGITVRPEEICPLRFHPPDGDGRNAARR